MSIQNSGFIKELQKSKQRIKVNIKILKSHCLGKFDHCVYRDHRMIALNFYLLPVHLKSTGLIQLCPFKIT